MGAAIDYFSYIGMSRIEAYEHERTRYLYEVRGKGMVRLKEGSQSMPESKHQLLRVSMSMTENGNCRRIMAVRPSSKPDVDSRLGC